MIIYPQESYDIIAAAIDVHKEFGCGLLEEIYQEAFEQELILRKIPYEREKNLIVVLQRNSFEENLQSGFCLLWKNHYRTESRGKISIHSRGADFELFEYNEISSWNFD